MSPTEIPITPSPHETVATPRGIASWRPAITSVAVHPAGPGRHLVLTVDGRVIHRFRLSGAVAAHLAALLASASGDGDRA